MKIAVLGAGAMGSLYGAFLSKVHKVTLVDTNKEIVDVINKEGIYGLEPDGSQKNYKAKAVLTGTVIGVQDMIIVFVKGIFTQDVIRQNISMIGEHTLVLTLQNGAGNNRDIAKYVSKEQILVGTSSHNSVLKKPGVFYHSGTGPTNIGPDVWTEENVKKAVKASDALAECGFETHVMDNIQEVLWEKLFVNCGVNGLSMIAKVQLGEIYKNMFLWEICRDIVYECVETAKADGTVFDKEAALEAVKQVCIHNKTGYASMYQDHMNHRKTEIDRINGVIVELADQYGISVPCNKMLVKLVHGMEK